MNLGMKGSNHNPLRVPHHGGHLPMMGGGPEGGPPPPGGGPMVPTIKQEGNDPMVPGQTHLGSPDTVTQYVDSTTYPSRLTPPESNTDFFALQEELLNGTEITELASFYHYAKISHEINL